MAKVIEPKIGEPFQLGGMTLIAYAVDYREGCGECVLRCDEDLCKQVACTRARTDDQSIRLKWIRK